MLLQAGSNPDTPEMGGVTALHRASDLGHTDAVRALLASRADPNLADQARMWGLAATG